MILNKNDISRIFKQACLTDPVHNEWDSKGA